MELRSVVSSTALEVEHLTPSQLKPQLNWPEARLSKTSPNGNANRPADTLELSDLLSAVAEVEEAPWRQVDCVVAADAICPARPCELFFLSDRILLRPTAKRHYFAAAGLVTSCTLQFQAPERQIHRGQAEQFVTKFRNSCFQACSLCNCEFASPVLGLVVVNANAPDAASRACTT